MYRILEGDRKGSKTYVFSGFEHRANKTGFEFLSQACASFHRYVDAMHATPEEATWEFSMLGCMGVFDVRLHGSFDVMLHGSFRR
jgi:hypothetical protein